MMGALLHYITHAEPDNFQPMKAAMGLLPELTEHVRNKKARYVAYAERAHAALEACLQAAHFTTLTFDPALETAALSATRAGSRPESDLVSE
jgi:hypothetical protein